MQKIKQTNFSKGTSDSIVVNECQVCGSPRLKSVLFLGNLPPVNEARKTDSELGQVAGYPLCAQCNGIGNGVSIG